MCLAIESQMWNNLTVKTSNLRPLTRKSITVFGQVLVVDVRTTSLKVVRCSSRGSSPSAQCLFAFPPQSSNMSNKELRAAILIISDTAHADPSTDKAGHILDQTFLTDGGDQWVVAERRIIPDDVLAIQRAVKGWCDGEDFMNLIVTTGGTGFAVKDQTPEAVTPLIHRYAPGLV